MPEVPPRLLRRGRPVDPDFDPDEDLYRACTREEVYVDRLLPERISFRDWSLNRGKYSDPTDVLIGRDGFGIATFKARDVPARLNSQSGIAFDFRLEHAPQEDNYSHARIIVGRAGNFQADLKVPATVKKEFRLTLSDKATIIRQPQV